MIATDDIELSSYQDIRHKKVRLDWQEAGESIRKLLDDRYEVKEFSLGEGGQAIVWDAQDTILEREVALKQLKDPHPNRRRKFIEEARLQASLEHAVIVPIFEVHADSSNPCFSMRKIDGLRFSHFLRRRHGVCKREYPARFEKFFATMTLLDLLRLFSEIASGVEYLHRRGLIHRDLKPQNIILDALGRIYLVDFGLTVKCENATDICGTIAYADPRLLEKNSEEMVQYAKKADIFALGMILMEILCNRYQNSENSLRFSPYKRSPLKEESSLRDYLQKIRYLPVRAPHAAELRNSSQVPDRKALVQICRACLGVDKHGYLLDDWHRGFYDNAGDIARDIRNLLEHKAGYAFRYPLYKRLFWFCADHFAAVTIALVLFMLIAGFLIIPAKILAQSLDEISQEDDLHKIDIRLLRAEGMALWCLSGKQKLAEFKAERKHYRRYLDFRKQNKLDGARKCLERLKYLSALKMKETEDLCQAENLQKESAKNYAQIAAIAWIAENDIQKIPIAEWKSACCSSSWAMEAIHTMQQYLKQAPDLRKPEILRRIDFVKSTRDKFQRAHKEFCQVYQRIFQQQIATASAWFPADDTAASFENFLRYQDIAAIYLLYRLTEISKQPESIQTENHTLLLLELWRKIGSRALAVSARTRQYLSSSCGWLFLGYYTFFTSFSLSIDELLRKTAAQIKNNESQQYLRREWLPAFADKITSGIPAKERPALLQKLGTLLTKEEFASGYDREMFVLTVERILVTVVVDMYQYRQLSQISEDIWCRFFWIAVVQSQYASKLRQLAQEKEFRDIYCRLYKNLEPRCRLGGPIKKYQSLPKSEPHINLYKQFKRRN